MQTVDIWFVNLGIRFTDWVKSFSVFGYEIYFYGVIIATAVMAGLFMAQHVAKKTGQNPDTYMELALYAVVAAIIGARIYYVVFAWDSYKDNPLEVFNLRGGGLAIYGGIIAAALAVYVFARVKKLSFTTLADTACVGLTLGQCIGRWSNFFNMEAFGGFTNNMFAMRLNIAKVNPGMISEELMTNAIVENGITYIQVHPTFLYESLWNGGVVIMLLLSRKTAAFKGEMLCRYLAGYGLGRLWIEGLRTDQLKLFGSDIAVSQALSLLIVIVSVAIMVIGRGRVKKH